VLGKKNILEKREKEVQLLVSEWEEARSGKVNL